MVRASSSRQNLRDAIIVYLAAVLLAAAVVQIKKFFPPLRDHASLIVAVLFVLVPVLAVRLRGEDIGDYGFNLAHWKSEVLFIFLLSAVIFPLYLIGFKMFWHPVAPFRFRIEEPYWALVLNHLLVVALPEEILFRGFIQQCFAAVWKKRIKVVGINLGWHIPAAAALFAIGHLTSNPHPNRLATFFPALIFGIVKERRGSLVGCTLFHAACNIFSDIVVWGYFPRSH